MGSVQKKERSKAGLSTWKRHHDAMMPWSYVLFGTLLVGVALFVLSLADLAPL